MEWYSVSRTPAKPKVELPLKKPFYCFIEFDDLRTDLQGSISLVSVPLILVTSEPLSLIILTLC